MIFITFPYSMAMEEGTRRLRLGMSAKKTTEMAEMNKAELFTECLQSMDCAMHHVSTVH
jgi:hypothetical protein